MRTLGVDHGTVRVGLALSDELGMLATPLETVENPKTLARIQALITEKNISKIVVGLPRNMDGSYGPKAEEVRKFAEHLKQKVNLPVVLWDERLTTRSVERMLIEADVSRQKRKDVIDKLAAQQILQSYLDSQAL
jgi:putative holliday junction resolvase